MSIRTAPPQHSRPPRVPGLPLLGSALALRSDMTAFLLRAYDRYGAAFRIGVLNREYTILAGLDANRLLRDQGDALLTGERFFGGFSEAFHTPYFLPAMHGEAHRHLRRALRPGYSREALTPHGDALLAITREHVRAWAQQPRVRVVEASQRLITDQLGIVLGGRALGEYFPHVRTFMRTIIDVTVLGTAPRALLGTRRYQQARDKTREFLHRIIEAHRDQPGTGDLIDVALHARNLDDQAFAEDDLVVIALGAYVAGMDTLANTFSFMLYALLRHPKVLAAVRAEADALFSRGTPLFGALRGMKALHGAALETLRLYMVAPVTLRTARVDFEFGGCHIPAGADMMIANGVTHFLPDYFPDPYRFDITRDHSTVPSGAFSPFTLGAHTCLAAGMAETLLMFTTAAVAHLADLTLHPPGYTARIISTPAPNPGRAFAMQVRPRQEGCS